MVAKAIDQLRLQSARWGIELSQSQTCLLNVYADILSSYQLANVIGTTKKEDIILDHIIDSLSCLLVEDLHRKRSLIDVGTGGGLPGVALAIARSELQVTLLEVTDKKVRFLDYAKRILDLRNLKVLHARAEEVGDWVTHRETFDIATARALSTLPIVVEYCAPLVRTGGAIFAMKARLSEEELSNGAVASRELGAALREVRQVKYSPPLQEKERRLVVLDKVEATPARFPRRVGLAKKRPLGV